MACRVLRKLDSPGPPALVGDTRQVIADNRPEDLLAAADYDQAVYHVPVRGIFGLPAKTHSTSAPSIWSR